MSRVKNEADRIRKAHDPSETDEERRVRRLAYQAAWNEKHPERRKAVAKKHAASDKRKAWLKEYNAKNREVLREKKKAWAKGREEHIKQQNAEWHQRNIARRTNAYLVRTYGITLDEYNALLAEQGGGCASCGALPLASGRRMPVDHCHVTGRVRGILCTSCNITLGRFNDNPTTLRRLADYIDRSVK